MAVQAEMESGPLTTWGPLRVSGGEIQEGDGQLEPQVVAQQLQQLHVGAQQYQPPSYQERQFKTRLCVYLASGACPHGARCLFAHSVEELRSMPRSACAEYKTKLCRYSFADCPFAAVGRCQFAHSVDELRTSSGTHGASARRFKTRLCKYHMAGHCPYAATNTCQFAHSEEELRSPPTYSPRPTALEAWYSTALNGGESADKPAKVVVLPQRQQQSARVVVATQQPRPENSSLRASLEQKRFTKLCKYFLAGHCPFSASGTCQFAHSAGELRRRSPPPASPRKSGSRSPQRSPRLAEIPPLDDPWTYRDPLRHEPDWSFRADDATSFRADDATSFRADDATSFRADDATSFRADDATSPR
ncbi:hypothetical protein CTAYLR_008008 [Chrysophaeum taylorii]|uniref:C3H1-type domain-containing protein n=1 Tax=Chrysophaeum taylorii TaxID=2483200 RepID=A0AAD7XKC7_9STRA|nr:hypothetical protein CTAYLR_008008 [Chrysophaeum taylorii]